MILRASVVAVVILTIATLACSSAPAEVVAAPASQAPAVAPASPAQQAFQSQVVPAPALNPLRQL